MLVHVFVCSIETKALALPAHALLWDREYDDNIPSRYVAFDEHPFVLELSQISLSGQLAITSLVFHQLGVGWYILQREEC